MQETSLLRSIDSIWEEHPTLQKSKTDTLGGDSMLCKPYFLERIFHPVGQGAFYSETHGTRDCYPATIVYDCGSLTSKQNIKESIIRTFSRERVEILFISHFHADHYNGMEYIKPKYIVLPRLNEYEKIFFGICSKLGGGSFDVNYEDSLREMFPRAWFIYVQQVTDEEGEPGVLVLDPEGEAAIPREGETTRTIESGTRLRMWWNPKWVYVPINPKLDAALIGNFKQRLEEAGIEYASLLAPANASYFDMHREIIERVYREVGRPNEYSMAVYSGPWSVCQEFSERYLRYKKGGHFSINHVESYSEPRHWPFCGCLYLGDMNLKEASDTQSQVLKKIYSLLPSHVYECLCTIQVPHHGSLENFNSALLSWYDQNRDCWKPWKWPMLYVISAGDPNQYRHPSEKVLEKLVNHHTVTQHPESLLSERFICI